MGFDAFQAEWLGKRVADPMLGSVGLPPEQWYQCVSLIKQYLREDFGIEAGFWGDAINYATNTNPVLLARFYRLAATDVLKGDIVVLNGLSGNAAGHIMIGTGANNTTQFDGLEQNGAGSGTGLNSDAIRTRWVAKSRIAAILRPHPVPVPEPVAPSPPPQPPAPRVLPTAPLTASPIDPYLVVVEIDGYFTSNQAVNRSGSNSKIPPGTYTIFNKRYAPNNQLVALNITSKPGQPGWWINPEDNVPKPFVSAFPPPALPTPASTLADVVPDWRTTYRPFVDRSGLRTPVKYVALESYVVKDLAEQKADVALHQWMYVIIGGTFVKDAHVYGRPQQAAENFLWYGIPMDENIIEPYAKLYNPKTTTAERQALHSMTFYDYLVIGYEQVATFFTTLFGSNKK